MTTALTPPTGPPPCGYQADPRREDGCPIPHGTEVQARTWTCPLCGMLWRFGWYRSVINGPQDRQARLLQESPK